jgi:hypothetical protein
MLLVKWHNGANAFTEKFSFFLCCCRTEEANVTHERFTRAKFRETDDSRRNQGRATVMRRRRRKSKKKK